MYILRFYIVLFVLVFAFSLSGQTMESLLKTIEETKNPIEKAKRLNTLADTLIWQGEGTSYNPSTYIEQVLDICKTNDCGELYHQAKVMETYLSVNAGEHENIYNYALPTLGKYSFEDPVLAAYLNESCGLFYFFQGKLDSVKYYIEASEAILKKNAPEDKRMGAAYEYLGFYYSFSSIHDTSLVYMNKAANFHLSHEDTLAYVKTIKFLSSFHAVMGEQENALKNLQKAKDFIKIYPPSAYYIHRINIGIANIQTDLKDFEHAEIAYKEGLATLQADKVLSDEEKLISLWDFTLGIATVMLRTERAKEALEYIAKAEEYTENSQLGILHKTVTKLLESEARVALKQYELANSLLKEIFIIHNNSSSIDAYNVRIAKILSSIVFEGRMMPSDDFQDKIEPVLNRIIENNKGDYSSEVLEAHKLRTVLNIAKGNSDAAIDDMRNTLIQIDTLLNRDKIEAVEQLLISYQSKEKDQQIKIQELKLAKQNWQRSALLALAIGLLLLAIIIYVIYSQKRRYANQLEKTVKERTEDLKVANEELKQSNYELKTFNYIASHDIKEPIRNIGNYAGFIQRKLPEHLRNDLDDDFKTIRNSTTQLYTLVEDFSKYISFSHDEIALNKEKVDLNFLVESFNNVFYETLQTKNARIIKNDLPIIQSNSSMLYIVLKNLIENGLKYNQSLIPTIEIFHSETSTHHEIIVSDNGIGIEEDYHEQIFEMFKRLHNRTEYQGSGIGLAIVKLGMNKMNGIIRLESSKENGSQFVLSLPK